MVRSFFLHVRLIHTTYIKDKTTGTETPTRVYSIARGFVEEKKAEIQI